MNRLLLSFSLLTFFTQMSSAQKIKALSSGNKGYHQEYIEFSSADAPAYLNKAVVLNENHQLVYLDSKTISSEKDKSGFTHYRVQQLINNIPVENAEFICHVYKGKLLSQNGYWINNQSTLNALPHITLDKAVNVAQSSIGASRYKWEIPGEESFIKAETGDNDASYYPKAILVYYNKPVVNSTPELHLAYKLDIYAQEPLMRKWVFVDASTGAFLGTEDQLHETNATGTAVTGYSGTQTITTDKVSNTSYRLREIGRGNGIQTYNMKKGVFYSLAVDFTDSDNNWNNVNSNLDQYATDAHWGAEKTYDFFYQKFNRNSIDNAGFAIKSYVHYSRSYFNAFWDGSRMTYGDGSSVNNNKPLTSLDVCGHEISHGLTSFTAKLNYSNESGALNEGFSDIFGTAIEWYARPARADWLIGGDFYTIRSMSNPKAYSQPSTYLKQYWYTGTGDNGGVHTNSGVLNFWFYLLTQGGSGTNDNSFVYNVSGIGMAKSQAIAYRTLTTYLVATSNYANARTYSIKSAEDLYGVGSNEAIQTKNAWDAVGVGGGLSPAGRTTELIAKNTSYETDAVAGTLIFPNPANSYTQLTFTDATGGLRIIELIDIKGNVVEKLQKTTIKGTNRMIIVFPASLNRGKYWIRLNGKTMGSVIRN